MAAMDMNQIKQTFVSEAQELLAAMEEALLAVEGQADQVESVNAMFRAVHTIKGSAGLFGLDAIVKFAHAVESVLDRVRSRKLGLSGALVGLLLECHDHLTAQVSGLREENGGGPATPGDEHQLLERLVPYLDEAPKPQAGVASRQPSARGQGPAYWHISIRFSPDVFRNGMDPASFVRYLATLGKIVHLKTLLPQVPLDDTFDPEVCHLGIELDLDSSAERSELEDVFEFIRDESLIRIIPPHAKVEEYLRLIRELPEEERFLGEILVAGGCITRKELEAALRTQQSESYEDGAIQGRKLGTILIEDQSVPVPVVAAALEKQKKFADHQGAETKVIRVQADKLDRLVDLVGELVIAGAASTVLASRSQDGRMIEASAAVSKLVEEIRDNALSLRMVQIGESFNRFRRVVRDVSQGLGKSIELEIQGAETELDKSIVEKLNDPLMHLVRNAIDHGIEPLDVRLARGKPEAGSLSLNAFHESGSIVLEVTDDGGGLNKAKILEKAVERGLVDSGAQLTDQEIAALIFEPGFSTAQAVSDLSGRGVGMDVVRKNVDALRGSIEVETYEGCGTTVRLRLPLTLAIIDGFRVAVEDTCYVIPMDMVIECLDLGPFLESEENHLINLRGEVLPFLRLRETFRLPGPAPARERVVVAQCGDRRAGLVVDKLLGEFQTVIKPLGELFRNAKGLGGSTILGSGEVALILDVPELIQEASEHHASSHRIPALVPTV